MGSCCAKQEINKDLRDGQDSNNSTQNTLNIGN